MAASQMTAAAPVSTRIGPDGMAMQSMLFVKADASLEYGAMLKAESQKFARVVLETFREDTALGTPALMQRFAARSSVVVLCAPLTPETRHLIDAELGRKSLVKVIDPAPAQIPAPLVLRTFEGCSYEEIAGVLGISVAAVRGRLHRARLELLEAMRPWA